MPLILLLSSYGVSHATHIVGGELNYTYLGNDSIYVKVKVYRDSINADPYFDMPLQLYVYDSSDNYVHTFLIPLPDVKLVIPQIEDSCFVEPPNVLVDFVIYEDTLHIPGISTGYTFAYFRCCRNDQILNIESVDFLDGDTLPGEKTGAVYPATIPDFHLNNSNPEFITFPPVAICVDKRLSYDHSAIDPDGDSLVYELCTPYTGGNDDNVFGIPEIQRPPFQEVLFIEPYSLENVMGGVPLAIDQHTGLLTAVPNTLGRFVIAVCVNEYRSGEFLTKSRRDFQFNVVSCGTIYDADFHISPAPKIDSLGPFDFLVCDTTLTKQFTSELAQPATLFWDFGDGSFSSETDPIHEFPGFGSYEVMLIAGPGEFCADTMIKVINIQQHVTGADFMYAQDPCQQFAIPVQFTDASNANVPIVSWEWVFGDGGASGEQNPVHTYIAPATYDVGLLIIAESGCCALVEKEIITYNTGNIELPDTLVSCYGDSVLLPLQAPEGSSYQWSPGSGLSDPNIQQPNAYPASNNTYDVTVAIPTVDGDTCYRRESCVVLVEDILPDISLENIGELCSREVDLTATTTFTEPVEWIWSQDIDFSDTLAIGNSLDTVMSSNQETYYVQVASRFCLNADQITLRRDFLDIGLDSIVRCGAGAVMVEFDVSGPSDDYELTWMIGDSVFVANEVFEWDDGFGVQQVIVSGENIEGCSDQDTSFIAVFPNAVVQAFGVPTEVQSGDTAFLFATDDEAFQYEWAPVGPLNDPSIFDPAAIMESTTVFEVMVLDTNGCIDSDTVLIIVKDLPCDESSIFVPNAFSPNDDGLNDVFRPRGDAIESMVLSVYDRWGNKVFEGNDIEAGWDGSYNGRLLSSDSYGYLLHITCEGNLTFRKQGNITLLR
ncbi:MAG: T9SS type B sorting domain-containing protein [Bacteroidetes bacterium]|nr:T9SS type B sorting domain-containing protein [Bacteroidota bacterium]